MDSQKQTLLTPEEFEAEFGKSVTKPGKTSSLSHTIKALRPELPIYEEADEIRNRIWATQRLITWKNQQQKGG